MYFSPNILSFSSYYENSSKKSFGVGLYCAGERYTDRQKKRHNTGGGIIVFKDARESAC